MEIIIKLHLYLVIKLCTPSDCVIGEHCSGKAQLTSVPLERLTSLLMPGLHVLKIQYGTSSSLVFTAAGIL